MRNFLISLLTFSLTACSIDDGEWGASEPISNIPAALLITVTPTSSAVCAENGQVATVTISSSQGEAVVDEIDLSKDLKFGTSAALEIQGGDRRHDFWDNGGLLHPRHLTAERETLRLTIDANSKYSLLLTVDPDDCPKFGQPFVSKVHYYDIGLGENQTLKGNW
jgi:hypothetical protein